MTNIATTICRAVPSRPVVAKVQIQLASAHPTSLDGTPLGTPFPRLSLVTRFRLIPSILVVRTFIPVVWTPFVDTKATTSVGIWKATSSISLRASMSVVSPEVAVAELREETNASSNILHV